jgi:hypothetical protein
MSTAGSKPLNVTYAKYTGKNATAFVKGVGVFFSTTTANALEVDVAIANSKCIGVSQAAQTGDGTAKHEVALLAAGGTVTVKCSGTATAGEYATCGTGGFENLTVGGGTVVKHVVGVFLETGVISDFVEMMPCRMPAVTA